MEFLQNINFTLLLICVGCVWFGIGIFAIFMVLYASHRHDGSFREFLNKGIEDVAIPYPIMVILFFVVILLGWPLILHSTLNDEDEVEENESSG